MNTPSTQCPVCESPRVIVLHEPAPSLGRRDFLRMTAAAAAATTLAPWARAAERPKSETLVQQLYKSFSEQQRTDIPKTEMHLCNFFTRRL